MSLSKGEIKSVCFCPRRYRFIKTSKCSSWHPSPAHTCVKIDWQVMQQQEQNTETD